MAHTYLRQHTQVGVRITTIEGLESFVASASRIVSIGRVVEDLTLVLVDQAEDALDIVRRCLQLTPHIESLVLDLPFTPPVDFLDPFLFPKIQLLSTNIPHDCLSTFLSIHPSLRSLVLRYCGDHSICPLKDVSLAHIIELQCPSRCLPAIANGQVARATVNLTRLASNALLAIGALSSSPLYCLSIDFFPNDYDLLIRVAAAAPTIRKLKLVEKPRPQRRGCHIRRPWNDHRAWHNILLKLSHLEELALHTLTRVSSARRPEAQIISSWANGPAHRMTTHPTLYHIGIKQPGLRGDDPQLTEWFKGNSGGPWDCVVNVTGNDVQL
ncbi:uncharacterized protein C8Q71DRAFT_909099 [Rhodofomes roseus]|uniref:Uncharacterized protein n=1 Tax=Rhodofomes roseus TaxID=34475 RepID=A0ABQ8K9Z3_9APHY|nr:uncharacterized protein C8Q71DRAFT_909099 [Rhodofomes roseus]KAH9834089.1 hypothetical protein C8Q71DRAFT_909099 [Rhodofomes roseus]